MGGADDDLVLAEAVVIAALEDQREQHHLDGGMLGLELPVGERLAAAGAIVHERGIEVDLPRQLAVTVVLWLQRREHHVLGALGAHLDGDVNRGADHVAQRLLDLLLEVGGWRQERPERLVDFLHDGLAVLLALRLKGGAVREECEGGCAPVVDCGWWACVMG